jgi:hypothetical protein
MPALAAAAGLLFLYLHFPDRVYVFDGLMFSYIIERRVVDLGAVLFNKRHPLFVPFMMVLRDALGACGARIGAYELVQKTNACLGVAGILLYGRLLLRVTRDAAVSALFAAALGLSYAYWTRATEGQVYMFMTFGALGVAWTADVFLERPAPIRAWLLLGAFALAASFHMADAALFPMAAAAVWLGTPAPQRRRALTAIVPVILASGAILAWILGIRGPASLLTYLWNATEFGSNAGGWADFLAAAAANGSKVPWRWASPLRELSSSLWVMRAPDLWMIAAGAALVAAAAAAWAAAWPRLDLARRRFAFLCLLGAAGFALLNGIWSGGLFFGAPPLAFYLILTAIPCAELLGARRRPEHRRLWLILGALSIAALGAWNLRGGILPQSLTENNGGYRRALFVRDHTVSTGWIVTSGLGFGNSKVYLTEFAHRSTQVLEYTLRAMPKAQALASFREFVGNAVAHGLPIYVLSDLIADRGVSDSLRSFWGVTPEEIRDCFGPGRFVVVAAYDDKLSVSLFLPDAGREALIAGLAFNILDMDDAPRVAEARALLAAAASGLSPDARRRADALLRRSNDGALLTLEGMSPYLTEETRRSAGDYAARFMRAPGPEARRRLADIRNIIAAP